MTAEEMYAAIQKKPTAPKPLTAEEMFSAIKSKSSPVQNAPVEAEKSWGDRALQAVHGLAEGTGNFLDMAGNALYKAGQQGNYLKVSPETRAKVEPKFTESERLPAAVNQVAGKELRPGEEDTAGKFLHGAGQFIAPPYLGAGKAIEGGAKALGKFAAKEVGMGTAASGAINLTPSATEEGGLARTAEDFGKALLGPKVASSALKAGKFTAENAIKGNLLNALKEQGIKAAAKSLSTLSKPDPKVFEAAKKYGIDLPFNVGMNNPVANFLHNNVYKSIFTNQAYKKIGEKANEQMMDKVRKSVESLGSVGVTPKAASDNFAEYLGTEKKVAEEQVTKLYNEATESLTNADRVMPTNTFESINFINDKLQNTPYMSAAGKKVKAILDESMGNLNPRAAGDANPLLNTYSTSTLERNPHLLEEVLKNGKVAKGEPLERLINLRSNLMQALNYDADVKGAQRYISGLIKAVDKDIESVGNKQFLEKWRGANKFKKDIDVGIYKSDMANSLLNGQAPREAFSHMNTVQGIKEIERIASETSRGKQLFNDLKAAKAREILGTAIQGSLETGDLKHGQFAKLFSSKNEKQLEVLTELLGKEQVKKLKDIATISESFSKSGRDLLNTSGTAIASADIGKLEKIALGAMGLLTFSNPGAAALGTGAHAATINLSSKLASNQNFISEMRRYALAREKGNEKQASTILGKLIKMGVKEQHAIKFTAQQEAKKAREKE